LDIDEELGDGQRMMDVDLDADDFEGAIPIDGISIDDTPGEQMILGSAFGPSIDKAIESDHSPGTYQSSFGVQRLHQLEGRRGLREAQTPSAHTSYSRYPNWPKQLLPEIPRDPPGLLSLLTHASQCSGIV
jgi:hypothetical protein